MTPRDRTLSIPFMPLDLAEQIALHGSYVMRTGSPLLEAATSKMIEDSFRELLQSHYLYQKVSVNLDGAVEIVRPILLERNTKWGISVEEIRFRQDIPKYVKDLRAEIEKRVWSPATRQILGGNRFATIPHATALGASNLEHPIHFYLPNIEIRCGAVCKKVTLFSPQLSSVFRLGDSTFPRTGEKGTEQMYEPVYRCEVCRTMVHAFLVHRVGQRLHLCGAAPRREAATSRTLIAPLDRILADAEQAAAEQDVFAGFYHLRTLVEHYIKGRINAPLTDQIRGDDLVERHYATLKPEWRSVLPSLSDSYSKLSENLHARRGKLEIFKELRDRVCDHIEMVTIFERSSTSELSRGSSL